MQSCKIKYWYADRMFRPLDLPTHEKTVFYLSCGCWCRGEDTGHRVSAAHVMAIVTASYEFGA